MLSAPFKILDDEISILNNTQIESFKNILSIFKSSFFGADRYYRPLVTLSFTVERQLFGLNSFFFNLTNLILHLCVSLLVFRVCSRILKNEFLGFLVGILFVIHPINAEAVSHIAGRSILLSAFFEWSSFILYLIFREKKKISCYLMSLGCFCLALLSKESSLMFPAIIFIYEYIFHQLNKENILKRIKPVLGFFLISVIYLFLRKDLGIVSMPHSFALKDAFLGILTFMIGFFDYLRILTFPCDLYFERIFSVQQTLLTSQFLLILLIIVISVFVLIKLRKHIDKRIVFFGAFTIITFFPVCQIIPLRLQPGYIFFPNHFWYVPSVGIFSLLAILILFLHKNFSGLIFKIVIIPWLIVLGALTVQENIYATSPIASQKKAIFYQPHHQRAHAILGLYWARQKDFKQAEYHFREVLKVDPGDVRARISLGRALIDQDQYWKGLSEYENVAHSQDFKDIFDGNIREAYATLEDRYRGMLLEDPKNAAIYFSLGVAYSKEEKFLKAIEMYKETLKLDPEFENAHQNLCFAYHMLGKEKKAQTCLEEGIIF